MKTKNKPVGTILNPQASDMFFREQIRKERDQTIDNFRKYAVVSSNPSLRSMYSGAPTLELASASRKSFESQNDSTSAQAKELGSDGNGSYILSGGIFPSLPPARYTSFAHSHGWSEIEDSYLKCKREMESLDEEIRVKQTEIQTKIRESARSNSTSSLDICSLESKPGSAVWGSSFRWNSACSGKSASQSQYDWPSDTARKHELCSGSQYGQLTKWCDDPRGNIYVNVNAKKKTMRKH